MLSNRNSPLSTSHLSAEAVAHLRAGALIGLPTETVYGLAADASDDRAVAAIFERKQRPAFNPLISHVADAAMAQRYVAWNILAERLAAAFWPGPLTLVLPRRADSPLSLLVSAGGDTAAIRAPRHALAQAIIRAFDGGLSAPSANRSGRISPTCAAHVREEFPDLPVFDGGPTEEGIESTVIDCTGERAVILRPGSITVGALRAAGVSVAPGGGVHDETQPRSPGQMLRHYAPQLPLRLEARSVAPGEALLAFGPHPPAGAAHMVNLSETGNMREAAANLFAAMRALDQSNCQAIAVMPIPHEGLGVAINDRLRRAAQA